LKDSVRTPVSGRAGSPKAVTLATASAVDVVAVQVVFSGHAVVTVSTRNTDVAGVSPGLDAVRVNVPAPVTLRPVKVATPPTALRVVVPLSVPEPAVVCRVSVTGAVDVVTRLPEASTTRTETLKAVPDCVSGGSVTKRSAFAVEQAPATVVVLALCAESSPRSGLQAPQVLAPVVHGTSATTVAVVDCPLPSPRLRSFTVEPAVVAVPGDGTDALTSAKPAGTVRSTELTAGAGPNWLEILTEKVVRLPAEAVAGLTLTV
jgi:hypothetical protein